MNAPVYIYVIAHKNADGWGGPAKIGVGNNPTARVYALQSGNPKPIALYGYVTAPGRDEARSVEKHVHGRLLSSRLAGEWFCVEPEVALQHISLTIAGLAVRSGLTPEEALEASLALTFRADKLQAADAR